MMEQPTTAETLFEDFVEQIEFLGDAIATQVPCRPEQIVSIAFTLIYKLGLYYDGAKECRRKLAIDKSWDNLKECFAQEFHEVSVVPITAQAAGYAHIYVATGKANTAVQYQIEQTHAQALTNFATATTSDRQAVGTFSTTNATLTA